MSRPKHYWYGTVKKMIERLPQLDENKLPELIYLMAYEKAKEATLKKQDGALIMKYVEAILVKKNKTVISSALEIGYSERVVQKWVNDFVNTVGKYCGY